MIKTIALCLTLALATLATDVQVKNLRLFVGEDEFFIKGMAYSPSPLEKTYDGQNEGTGLCKPRPTYATGSHSAVIQTSGCNSEDYFDAAVYSFGNPNGWFTALWERDFPLIQQLGVNTIRIYHAFPVTQAAIKNGAYTDKTVVGSNHIPFMDSAQAHGLKVVFPLFAESASLDVLDASWIQEYARNIIDEVGNHPALLMYTFGNELQFSSRDQAYIDKINGYIDYARNYQMTKWGRKIPFTVAVIDIPPWYSILFGNTGLHVDLITTNAGYRGFTFTDLWSTNLYPLACSRELPSLIGEMGVHLDTPQFDVPGWFPAMWSDVIGHKTQGSIGGFYFSWVEEHWKGVVPGADWTKYPDVRMGVVSQQPAGGSDPFAADVIVKKYGSAYDWDAAVSGYAQNPYKQDSAQTLSSAQPNYCDGTFQVIPAIPPPTQAWKPDATTVTTMPVPVVYFNFDTSVNNNKLTDLSGNGHDAILYGNPTFGQGVSGKALNLDGTQTAMISGLGSLSGTFTVSVWIYLNSAPDAETKIFSSKASWDDANGFEITLNPDQKIIKMVGGGSSVAQYGGLAISTGNWFHVAVTVESSGRVNLYFNGVQAAAATGVSPVVASTNGLFLGSENDKVAFLAGAFDELLIFDSVVGGDQMLRLANADSLPQFQIVVAPTVSDAEPTPSSSNGGAATSSGNGANNGATSSGNNANTNNAGGNSPSSTTSGVDTSVAATSAAATSVANNNGVTTSVNPTPSAVERPQNSAVSTAAAFGLVVVAMLLF